MPPRSRRSPAAGRAAPQTAPVEEQLEAHPDDVDVVEPEVDSAGTAGSEPAARDSRRGRSPSGRNKPATGRSSRQIASRSAPRKVLTPEELAARRRARNQVFAIFGVLILLGGAGFGAWWLFIRKDERVLRGQGFLASAKAHENVVDTCLRNRQPDNAQDEYEAALKDLNNPELGYAKDSASENDPLFAGLALWKDAKDLRDDILSRKPRIEKAKHDQLVEENVRDLRERFASFAKMDDAALIQLGKDVDKFLDNPVEPEAGRSEDYAKEYDQFAAEIRTLKSRIGEEQRLRREKVTSRPVRDARYEAEKLINEDRFKDALAKVDDVQRQFKDAELAPIRDMVTVSAKTSWDAAKKYADTNYRTATSPGSDMGQKKSALDAARHRMEQVVERFGLDEYVDQAKAELAKYGP